MELKHFGVKGMRWGVRRKKKSSDRKDKKSKARQEIMERRKTYTLGEKVQSVLFPNKFATDLVRSGRATAYSAHLERALREQSMANLAYVEAGAVAAGGAAVGAMAFLAAKRV